MSLLCGIRDVHVTPLSLASNLTTHLMISYTWSWAFWFFPFANGYKCACWGRTNAVYILIILILKFESYTKMQFSHEVILYMSLKQRGKWIDSLRNGQKERIRVEEFAHVICAFHFLHHFSHRVYKDNLKPKLMRSSCLLRT